MNHTTPLTHGAFFKRNSWRVAVIFVFALSVAVFSFGKGNVAHAADPFSGLDCKELSGNTTPVAFPPVKFVGQDYTLTATYTDSGAMYFGQYATGRTTLSPYNANKLNFGGGNIQYSPPQKPVYYAPASNVACATLVKGINGQPDRVYLQGWVWNDNIGWVSLYCPGYGNAQSGQNYSGKNRNIACGSVKYGVEMDPATGIFYGYAWSNAGWIRMNCNPTPGYGDTSYCGTSVHGAKLENLTNKTVKVPVISDPANPTVLTKFTADAWAWANGFQWLSFAGMKVPFDADCNLDPAVICEANDATWVSYSGAPLATKKMKPNEKATVSVTMKNSGTLTWASINYMFSPVPGTNNWKVIPSPNPAAPNQDQILQNSVLSEKTKTFTFDITAPAAIGTYDFQWQMKEKSTGFFGEKSPLVQIVVANDNAKISGPLGDEGTFQTLIRPPYYINGDSGTSTATGALNPVTQSQVRNLIYRNVQKWKKVASLKCSNGDLIGAFLFQSADQVLYCSGQDISIPPGKWNGNKTIIVDGGNVHITGSLHSTKGQLGIIVLKNKLNNPAEGNVYVYPDVRDLRVQIYADGSIYPVIADASGEALTQNGLPVITPAVDYSVAQGNTLFGQLYIQGMMISNNNPGIDGATSTEQLRSLGSLRSVPADPEFGSPISWNDYFTNVASVKNGVFEIDNGDDTFTSVKYSGYSPATEKSKRESSVYKIDSNDITDLAKSSVFINYEPPAQNLPGFDGIVGGGFKQTGGQ